MAKQIVHGEESRQAILRGVNLLADAVKVTPGLMVTSLFTRTDSELEPEALMVALDGMTRSPLKTNCVMPD